MNRLHHFKTATVLLAAWLLLPSSGSAEEAVRLSSRLSSRFLARGEQALLEVAVSGSMPTVFPVITPVKGVEIIPAGRGPQTQIMPGSRELEYVFEYLVSSYDIGTHVIPPVEVMAGGTESHSEPLEFSVFNPDELKWSEAEVGNTKFRYASAFRVMNPTPYNGETTAVEIKLYVPGELRVQDFGIPDFERDGVTAWRFQPSVMKGRINLLGKGCLSVSYPSTLTPTRTGKIGIGPATIRLVTVQYLMDGIGRNVAMEVNVTVPPLELDSLPLPDGAPDGFENAIGNYRLDVTTETTEIQEGDPVPLRIEVSGSGNLDTLHPPMPVETRGWKLYDAAPDQRGDERRDISGSAVFHQFIRPLEMKSAIPPFRLVYFDPKEKSYKTVTSASIPLRMSAAVAPRTDSIAPPQALAVPVERMTDILGLLHPADATLSGNRGLPGWVGHLIGGLLALALLAKALWMRHGHRFHKDPVKVARLGALREVERAKADDTGFLMAAGRFIERWLNDNPAPEVRAILTERDALCFQPEKPGATLDTSRRNAILRTLRKAAMACVIAGAAFLTTTSARAGDVTAPATEAYDSARYDEAVAEWLKAGRYEDLSPDVLYNIGNACYRAGSPGNAALYYRRALARDPSHQESRQNLRFIERKYGAITIHRPEYQYAITRIPLQEWKGMVWAGLWLCGLAALVFPATRPGARLRLAAVAALAAGPLLAAFGGLGWRYFPDDAEFAPLQRQAVIIGEKAILHTDAARTSPEVIDAPVGSLCDVIHESGRWAYVAFATKTRGWIPVEAIGKIVPEKTPEAPKIHKPRADGKSA